MQYWEKQYLENHLQSWTLRIERVVYEYKLGKIENYEAIDDISSYYTRGKDYLSYLISELELTTAQASEARSLWDNRLLFCYRACLYMLKGGDK
mgnify:CR=1 FL=1